MSSHPHFRRSSIYPADTLNVGLMSAGRQDEVARSTDDKVGGGGGGDYRTSMPEMHG